MASRSQSNFSYIRPLIKLVLQSKLGQGLSPSELLAEIQRVISDTHVASIDIKSNTLRTYLLRMRKAGEITNSDGKWFVLKRESIERRTGGS